MNKGEHFFIENKGDGEHYVLIVVCETAELYRKYLNSQTCFLVVLLQKTRRSCKDDNVEQCRIMFARVLFRRAHVGLVGRLQDAAFN